MQEKFESGCVNQEVYRLEEEEEEGEEGARDEKRPIGTNANWPLFSHAVFSERFGRVCNR